MSKVMKHFSHAHDLKLISNNYGREMRCTICSGGIAKGKPVYVCSKLSESDEDTYEGIHQKCAEFPQHIAAHPLHRPHHPLTLSLTSSADTSTNTRPCDYCDQLFSADGRQYYTYTCHLCPDGFRMHGACGVAPLPTPLPSDSGDKDDPCIVRFACHDRIPMALTSVHESEGRRCFACLSPRTDGVAYRCHVCCSFIHKACGDRLRRRIDHHPLHPPPHALSLRVTKPRKCDTCHRKDCVLVYGCCESGCGGFAMCTECHTYDSITIECRSHDHSLFLLEKTHCHDIRCEACKTSYDEESVVEEVGRTKSMVFRCMEMGCSFDLHFLCGPLPVLVDYEYHIHPLTLVDSSILGEADSDEHYCDACEEERDPQFRVYYCRDCKYVAHIHCLLFQIMKVLKEGTKEVQLEALGEDRWDFGIESIPESDHDQNLTMRDIMNKLTEVEVQRLINPLDLDAEKKASIINRNCYYRNLNSELIDFKGPIEDINGIQQLFRMDKSKFKYFKAELKYYVMEEGMILEDKYLRQKVQDVEGYLVPKTLAPILRTLLRSDEIDLPDSDLTREMKSVLASLLCVVVDGMCRTKFEDVTRDDIRRWFFYLHCLEIIWDDEFFLEIYKSLLKKFVIRAFIGNNVIKCHRETCIKLAQEIKALEIKLKKCKESYQAMDTYTIESPETSDLSKEFIKLASELKGKYLADKLPLEYKKPW